MLEIVGVDLAAVNDFVGLYIVLKDLDLQIISFFSQEGLSLLKDLSVGNGACRDRDRCKLSALCRCFRLCLRLVIRCCRCCAGSAAACKKCRCDDCCGKE